MDVLALIVAGLALAFSVYSFFREDRLNRRLAAIEEARREHEVSSQLRADVTAEFNRFVNSGGHTG